MSATDMLGHQDVCGLSAIDPHQRQCISVRAIPKDVGMLLEPVVETPPPHLSVHGNSTTPTSNHGIARLTRPNGVVVSLSPDGGGLNANRPCSVG